MHQFGCSFAISVAHAIPNDGNAFIYVCVCESNRIARNLPNQIECVTRSLPLFSHRNTHIAITKKSGVNLVTSSSSKYARFTIRETGMKKEEVSPRLRSIKLYQTKQIFTISNSNLSAPATSHTNAVTKHPPLTHTYSRFGSDALLPQAFAVAFYTWRQKYTTKLCECVCVPVPALYME